MTQKLKLFFSALQNNTITIYQNTQDKQLKQLTSYNLATNKIIFGDLYT